MTERRVNLLLLAVCALGAALRYHAWSHQYALHLDEFYQYVEPAFARLTGAGLEPWEFRAGVRSWVLPGFHGALMVLFEAAGVPRVWFGPALQAVWGVLSLSLIYAAFRAGSAIAWRLASGSQPSATQAGLHGGLMAAALCAAFPCITVISVHALSELPAMLCIVLAVALCLEMDETSQDTARLRVFWVGVLVAGGVLLRISYAPCALMPVATLVLSKRWRLIGPLALGASGPLLVFGVVDWVTWGAPFVSFARYVQFNLLDGKAAQFGVEAPDYYLRLIRTQLPHTIWVVAALCLIGARAGWLPTLTACGTVALLSTQGHKEPRFVALFWPLCLIAAAGTAGALVMRLRSVQLRRLGQLAAWLLVCCVLGDAYAHDTLEKNAIYTADRLHAQTWLGSHAQVSGVLVADLTFSGGQTWLGSTALQARFDARLLRNPLISHAVVRAGSSEEQAASRAGFRPVHHAGHLAVLAKQSSDRR